jgi:hypothetical protein
MGLFKFIRIINKTHKMFVHSIARGNLNISLLSGAQNASGAPAVICPINIMQQENDIASSLAPEFALWRLVRFKF